MKSINIGATIVAVWCGVTSHIQRIFNVRIARPARTSVPTNSMIKGVNALHVLTKPRIVVAAIIITLTSLSAMLGQASDCRQEGPYWTFRPSATETLNDCIAQAGPGSEILLYPGVYDEDVVINVSPFTLKGVVADWSNTTRVRSLQVKGTAVNHLQQVIVEDLGAQSLYLEYVHDYSFRNVWVRNSPGDGIILGSQVWRGLFDNVISESNPGHGVRIKQGAAANSVRFLNGSSSRNVGSGFYFEPGHNSGYFQISQTVEGNAGWGVVANGGEMLVASYGYYESNQLGDILIGEQVGQTVLGFRIVGNLMAGSGGAGDYGIRVLDGIEGWIENNRIPNHRVRNIEIGGSSGGRTSNGHVVYFYEPASYIAQGAQPSANLGGARMWFNLEPDSAEGWIFNGYAKFHAFQVNTQFSVTSIQTVNDNSPSLYVGANTIKLANTQPTDYTTFLYGWQGAELTLICTESYSRIIAGSNIKLKDAAASFQCSPDKTITFIKVDGVWYQK